MSEPYKASGSTLDTNIEIYIDGVFDQLQSDILLLPQSENFASEEDFKEAFEVLANKTTDLSEVTFQNLLDAVREDARTFVLIRTMLGLSPTEWAFLAEDKTGVSIPQNCVRDIDTKAANRESRFVDRSSLRTERVKALLEYAAGVLSGSGTDISDDVVHRYDKVDTGPDSQALSDLAQNGVDYHTLLYERYTGRPFASYRDSVSEKVGDRMEDAVELELNESGVRYYRTESTETITGFDQAPDFLIPGRKDPDVVIEAKITGDDGTARDKVTRVQHLDSISREHGNDGSQSFQVVACIDGRGFGVRRERMEALLKATQGKVFTTITLEEMVENTRMVDHVS